MKRKITNSGRTRHILDLRPSGRWWCVDPTSDAHYPFAYSFTQNDEQIRWGPKSLNIPHCSKNISYEKIVFSKFFSSNYWRIPVIKGDGLPLSRIQENPLWPEIMKRFGDRQPRGTQLFIHSFSLTDL